MSITIKKIKEVIKEDFWIMPATPPYCNEGIPYITSKNIKNGKINFSNINYILVDDYEKISNNRPIKAGDILISMIGTLGETAEVMETDLPFYGQNMFLVRLNEDVIRKRYFKYYFKSNKVKQEILMSQNKSTQNYLKANHIEQLDIPIVDFKNQDNIIEVLEKVESIIDKYKKQLALLEDLVKAQFVEMFGDPFKPKKDIKLFKFKDICTVHQGLQIPISERKNEPGENRYKYITIQYLNGKKEEEYIENPNKSVICQKEDILMTRTGNTGQVITDVQGVFHNNFFIINYNKEKLNREYLLAFLRDKEVRNVMLKAATTSTIPDLSHDKFLNIEIPIPTLKLQEIFANFIKDIDNSKFTIQKALDKTETLYNKLMQDYFGD